MLDPCLYSSARHCGSMTETMGNSLLVLIGAFIYFSDLSEPTIAHCISAEFGKMAVLDLSPSHAFSVHSTILRKRKCFRLSSHSFSIIPNSRADAVARECPQISSTLKYQLISQTTTRTDTYPIYTRSPSLSGSSLGPEPSVQVSDCSFAESSSHSLCIELFIPCGSAIC